MKVYLKSGQTVRVSTEEGICLINGIFNLDKERQKEEYVRYKIGVDVISMYKISDIAAIK